MSVTVHYNALNQAALLLQSVSGSQVFIISNKTIAPYYISILQQIFSDKQCDAHLLPDGEQYKTTASVLSIVEQLIEHHHRRDTTIVGLGGGVVCDVAGFVAATYLRGVRLIQVPTSLLAQVDAAIGGKNAVNHPLAKNSMGTFYQPSQVIIDPAVLTTLPANHFHAALSEVLKYGLVYDAKFFDWLEKNWSLILEKDKLTLQKMIQCCVGIKLEIVEQDEKDHGLRQILNFGHTLGHALEQVSNYELLHGEAVATGVLWALELSEKHCGLDHSLRMRAAELFALIGAKELDAHFRDNDRNFVLNVMRRDKKHRDQFNLILLEKLGKAKLVSFDTLEEIF